MISFIGGYHGQTAGSAGLSGHTAQAKAGGGGNVIKIPYPDPYRPVLGADRDPADAVLDYLENYILRTICPPEDTAGIIVEPVQSDGGDIVPPPRFLQGLERICRQHGIMLLIDEVKIGFGRSGRMFAFEHFGVVPDAVSLGKSMGGGMPISAVVGRRELLDVAPAINMYTMAGNPVACAAALAHLDEIDRLGLVGQAGAHRRLPAGPAPRAAAAASADRGRARAGPDAGPGDRARPRDQGTGRPRDGEDRVPRVRTRADRVLRRHLLERHGDHPAADHDARPRWTRVSRSWTRRSARSRPAR